MINFGTFFVGARPRAREPRAAALTALRGQRACASWPSAVRATCCARARGARVGTRARPQRAELGGCGVVVGCCVGPACAGMEWLSDWCLPRAPAHRRVGPNERCTRACARARTRKHARVGEAVNPRTVEFPACASTGGDATRGSVLCCGRCAPPAAATGCVRPGLWAQPCPTSMARAAQR